MRSRQLLTALFGAVSAACQRDPVVATHPGAAAQAARTATTTPPNVVVIVLDDARGDMMTRQFLPLMWARIADSGTVFTRGYANSPLCCPSRSTLLTGLFQHNHGVFGNAFWNHGGARMFRDQTTLATALAGAGYVTGLVGKYLNEYDRLTPWPYIPPGWGEWRGFSREEYYNYRMVERPWSGGAAVENAYGSTPSEYSTSVVARRAVDFIQSVPDTLPIFLLVTPFTPHAPATPAPQDVGSCSSLPKFRPPSFNEQDVSDQPAFVQALPLGSTSTISKSDSRRRSTCAALRGADRLIDSVVTQLALSGRLDNTYIVVTSDHGFQFGEHRLFLRKSSLFEESVRVLFAVRGPGISKRIDQSHMVQMADIAPTILEWAGQPQALQTNGASWTSILANPLASWRTEVLFEHLAPSPANERVDGLRDQQWSYHEYGNGDRTLYDMIADPFQTTNLAMLPQYASTAAALAARLAVLRTQ